MITLIKILASVFLPCAVHRFINVSELASIALYIPLCCFWMTEILNFLLISKMMMEINLNLPALFLKFQGY